MKPELEHQLVLAYPELFRDKDSPPPESLMCFGCECGDGWYEIVRLACDCIVSHVKRRDPDNDFRWFQIKEKWGTLRLYGHGNATEFIDGVIAMAEALSSVTCERCGKPGTTRGRGWVSTLCDECEVK